MGDNTGIDRFMLVLSKWIQGFYSCTLPLIVAGGGNRAGALQLDKP
jgi:hypothetical protein